MMVSMMIVVGGAVLVARRFKNRSVYSGRIHTARSSAAATNQAAPPDVENISAAVRYSELLHVLLLQENTPGTVNVVDEQGNTVGFVDRDRALHPPPSLAPLETATAEDFVEMLLPHDGHRGSAAKRF